MPRPPSAPLAGRFAGRMALGALLGGAACTPGGGLSSESAEAGDPSSADAESSGEETGNEEGFDPAVCDSWDTSLLDPEGSLPPVGSCEAGAPCPRFIDVTKPAGLLHRQYRPVSGSRMECLFDLASGDGVLPKADCEPQWFTGGAAVADVDADGWPDLFVTRLGAPDLLYRNLGDGRFEDITAAAGLDDCSFTNGAVFGDIDDDGDPDLLVTALGGYAHHLYINDGEGHFEERGEAWGFALENDARHGGQGVTLGDYDLDGRLDAHVNAWIEPHNQPNFSAPGPHGSRLLHNLGDRFEDVTESAGVSLLGVREEGIYGFSSAFVDLDDDRYPELVIAADFRSSRLFWNAGDGTFSDGTAAANVNAESNAMGSAFGDVDGDGDLDWFVSSIAERDLACPDTCPWKGSGNRLYRNDGARRFAQVTDEVGVRDGAWGWGAAFFDVDNDGDLDLYGVNGWPGRDLNGGTSHRESPARLWRNDGDFPFEEVAAEHGLDDLGQGRAVIPFDYDRDGDLDLFIANHAQPPRLLRNDGGNANAWLAVEVQGSVSNRDGRGAVIEVQLDPGGPTQLRQVGAGGHFLAEGPLRQHFGLGPDAALIHRVAVRWPRSGELQERFDVPARTELRFVEPG